MESIASPSPEDRPARCLPPKEFQPRSYQVKVFEVAARRNTIVVLETGAGKTMIAVMLINEFRRRLIEQGEKKLIVFLAPTVSLVHQQYEVIRDYVEFDVAEYGGTKGVDQWSAECWTEEVGTKNVVVMTPQLLLNALRHAFLTLDTIGLIIFDECHRASGSHPYTRLMKEFYHSSICKPVIFGMTASPIGGKGLSPGTGCEEKISKLESILDSKVFTVEDRAEVEVHAPSAKLINRYYDANKHSFEPLRNTLESSKEKVDKSLDVLQQSPSNVFKDTIEMITAARKSLSSYYQMIACCLDDLGLICAAEATKICIENIRLCCKGEDGDIFKTTSELPIIFLKEVLHSIEEILPHATDQWQDSQVTRSPEDKQLIWSHRMKAEYEKSIELFCKKFLVKPEYEELIKTGCGYKEQAELCFVSPKLDKLVCICRSFVWEELRCLVFVEKRITAKVLKRFMTMINITSLSVSYLTGGSSSKDSLSLNEQRTTLDSFHAGEVNLLFSTDVAEEGIDVTNCSCVIRFDLPKTVCSFVQSRGRARRSDSTYILMVERNNAEQRNQLFQIIRSEFLIRNSALYRDIKVVSPNLYREENFLYHVKSTGASLSTESSINLVHKYCNSLPKDRYYTPKPFFEIIMKDDLYECTLVLPPNAACQKIKGPLSSNPNLAKQLVSLEACKKLHLLGALNDHLLPLRVEPLEVNISGINEINTAGAGTTKRKELHGIKNAKALSGTWAHKPDNVTLNAYKINFICDQEGESYSPFVLLIEKVLDDDVATAEMELFLIPNKLVKTYVSPFGKIHLNMEQVEKSKLFQEFFFNGIFGRLFTGSRSSGKREFLLQQGQRLPWSSLNMYLILPLVSLSYKSQNALSIDWKGINECVSAVECLRSIYSVDGEYKSRSLSTVGSCKTKCQKSDIVHLANKSLETECLKNSVVFSVHNGRIYIVLDVINYVASCGPFDRSFDVKESHFVSFKDYYQQKYNIVLHHPEQPLLLLKQSHNPHNLLLSKSRFQDSSTGQLIMVGKEQVHAYMPPELLVHMDISIDILKSFYLLPSVMHRLESLMLSSQLREEIGYTYKHTRISSSLILEAITTLRCCESFSMERLELLGDSVLKYAVGCHLFLNYPTKHEGQLSDHRSWAVCNSTLYKLGITRYLQGYIRDNAFDPRRWVAPGQISLRPCPCNCGVDTFNVPPKSRYMTEETSIAVGKPCDKGHRWMCSKTIADCVEALVGAYYIGGGLQAAFSIMSWLGIEINVERKIVEEFRLCASHMCYLPKENLIDKLESKLNYRFTLKGLLLEAITHPSQQELGLNYCYQRLEFLGDSVLDLLITRYLFLTHKDIDPGELTDLRSALVNNENFAQAAVRKNLEQFLQHGSGILLCQITEYVRCISKYHDREDMVLPVGTPKGPKVLGDIVESIAGAVLVDTYLDLDIVWEVFQPILSPIITPDKLELPPLRELMELCSYLGYFINTKCIKSKEHVVAELTIQLIDELLVGHGNDKNKKAAKAQAAVNLLKDLKKKGISHAQYASRRTHERSIPSINSSQSNLDASISMVQNLGSSESSSLSEELCREEDYCNLKSPKRTSPVIIPVMMDKGRPRIALFDLCRTLQWRMPKFELTEEKFRSPVILNGVTMPNFNTFRANVMLHIPHTKAFRITGEVRTNKRSAQDSASLNMLLELERQGICIIKEHS